MSDIDIAPRAMQGAEGGGKRLTDELMGRVGYAYDAGAVAREREVGDGGGVGGGEGGGTKGNHALELVCVLGDGAGDGARCVNGLQFHDKYEGVLFCGYGGRRDGAGGVGGKVGMWNLENGAGRLERELYCMMGVSAMEVGGVGASMVVGGCVGGGVVMWDTRVRSGAPVVEFETQGSWNDGGSIVGVESGVGGGAGFYTASSGGLVCRWSVGGGQAPVGWDTLRGQGGGEVGLGCMGIRRGEKVRGDGNWGVRLFAGDLTGEVLGLEGEKGGWRVEEMGKHEGMVMGMSGHGGGGWLEDVVVSVGRDWMAKVWYMGREGGRELGQWEVGGGGVDVGWSEVNASVFAVGGAGGVKVVDLEGKLGDSVTVGLGGHGAGMCKVGWGRSGVLCGGSVGGRVGVWRCGQAFGRLAGAEWVANKLKSRMKG